MKYFVVFLFTISCIPVFAQNSELEKIKQMDQQKEYERSRQIRARIDSGINLLNKGDYELADEKFRFALANLTSIPSDLVFYFGKNSFYFGKYKQSIDWLSKYIQLKGTAGQYSSEAADILKQAEGALKQTNQAEAVKAEEVFSRDFSIDCGPAGKVTCPVCNGTMVVIRKDYLGETYKTCQYCEKGILTCEEYNKLLKGQLKPHPNR